MSSGADLRKLGDSLHERLLSGNSTVVSAEISEIFLPLLVNGLRRRFPRIPDPHLVETVAIDSLMAYLEEPERFDPAKGSLIGYLYMDAYRNLLDILRQQQKLVELHPADSEYIVSTPEDRLLEEASPIVQRMLAEVTDPTDQEMLRLMMEGVRETEAYAEVLGVEGLSHSEQASIVKRHKDRLKATLRRRIRRNSGPKI